MISVNGLLLPEEQLLIFGGKAAVASLFTPRFTFDTALPELWLQDQGDEHRQTILRGTVWAYPAGHIYGTPLPLTKEAWHILAKQDQLATS